MIKHYEEIKVIPAADQTVFEFVDDPLNLSKHMEKPTWKMLGGVDEKYT